MSGSVRPRRRRAAAGSLTYPARTPRTATAPSGRHRDSAYGCGCMTAVVLGIVVPTAGATFRGAALWRWARDTFPGGGYGFAVTVGALIPVTFAVGAISLARMNRSAQKARSAARVVVAVLCFALLMLLSTAAVEMLGPSRKHHDRTGGWAYAHYPWIWAVGVLSALVTGALVVTAYVVHARRRTGDGSTADGG